MAQFQLFDSVKLTEAITLSDGELAPEGTSGAIVEVLKDGEAYLVELFGGWVKSNEEGNFIPVASDEPDAFVETLGVELVYPQQLQLVKAAQETTGIRGQLTAALNELPEDLIAEVRDFAEFLRQKQQKKVVS
ncbi:DUF2281 domain-containing protein [Phormidium sp. FACHB-592]|uniref:DUF2281 domain-containing protein n=1 Tax=Stenomitos frigidus AS-A4 TaxID=2933935 RepID=A0ABV0KP47_9CYAN|nr:DUF2281 domain-containing protein [Phormidium sp. FACHB-592]MBD2075085.1 DUF2281 domain-containing protein [Phormidium sp. FACHB-592]